MAIDWSLGQLTALTDVPGVEWSLGELSALAYIVSGVEWSLGQLTALTETPANTRRRQSGVIN